jgi:hypothetical protein
MAFSDWHAKNPDPNPSFYGKLRWEAHTWGRQEFAKSFAKGGFAATAFAPTAKEAFISPWRRKALPGSRQYIANLEKLRGMYPRDMRIKEAIETARKPLKAPKVGMGLGGGALMGAMILAPAFMTEGPLHEKARAVTSGIGMFAGWEVGSKVGMGAGAAAGTAVLPGVGTAIGAAVGYLAGGLAGGFAGEEVTDVLTRIPDRMVEKERSRRKFDWGMHTAAFQTQRAHTMRQQSLAAMNRGQMSARSLLGQESVFVHR